MRCSEAREKLDLFPMPVMTGVPFKMASYRQLRPDTVLRGRFLQPLFTYKDAELREAKLLAQDHTAVNTGVRI